MSLNMKTCEIIKEVYKDAATELGNELFGVFLYGSQNYGLHTPTSDIDLTIVTIPDTKDILINAPDLGWHPNISHPGVATIHWIYITDFIHSITYKTSLSSIEYLCGAWQIINPKYANLWDEYFAMNSNNIVYGNIHVIVHNLHGMATRYLHDGVEKNKSKLIARFFYIRHLISELANGTPITQLFLIPGEATKDLIFEVQNNPDPSAYLLRPIDKTSVELEQEMLNEIVYNTKWENLPSQEEKCKEGLYLIMEEKKNG